MKEPSADDQWRGCDVSLSVAPRRRPRSRRVRRPTNGVLFTAVAQTTAIRALVGLRCSFSFPDTPSCRCCSRATAERPETVKPDSTSAVASGWRRPVTRGIGWRERFALLRDERRLQPLFAIALSLLGLAYTLGVLAATLSGFAVLFMIVAVARRNQLPPDRRFHLPYDRWIGAVHRGVSAESSGVDVALNVALALVVLTSLAGWATRSPSRTTPNRSPRRRS